MAELSVTAAVRECSDSGVPSDEQLAGLLTAALQEEGSEADGVLIKVKA